MGSFVSNRNSDGLTDENGHFRLPLKMMEGEVFSGFQILANTTPNMGVRITTGEAKIPFQDYDYAVWTDTETNLSIQTSSTSNNRIDRVVAYVDRTMTFTPSDINHPGALKFKVITGTPNNPAVAPTDIQVQTSVGAGNPWINLGQIQVGMNTTFIVSSNINTSSQIPMRISPSIRLPEITSTDGTSLKFATINEGQPLPSAIPGSTLVVLVISNS